MTSLRALKILLVLVGLAHIAIGIGLNVSSGAPQLIADLYGAKVEWTPQFTYLLKPLGVFMLVIGVLALVAAMRPQHHRAIVNGLALLLALRAAQRLLFGDEIQSAFGVLSTRNLVNAAFFGALALVLYLLGRAAARPAAA